jgi:hypothetical protein
MSMIGELTDLDRTVIEALSARYARDGEAAFDEAVSRLVIAVCAALAHTRGTARLAFATNRQTRAPALSLPLAAQRRNQP